MIKQISLGFFLRVLECNLIIEYIYKGTQSIKKFQFKILCDQRELIYVHL